MPTKKRLTRFGPPPDLKEGGEDIRPITYVQHWTRKEQIANAKADGTLAEMRPKEKA